MKHIQDEENAVWVVADIEKGQLAPVTGQLLGQARKLADRMNRSVGCILLGAELEGLGETCIRAGADVVYRGESRDLRLYQQSTYLETIVKLARVKQPHIILMASTHVGRELAPLVAAKLSTGLSAHCIDLCVDDIGVLEAKIPAYGGLLTITCPEKRPQMATCAQGVFKDPVLDAARTGSIIDLAVCCPEVFSVETLEVVEESADGVSLEGAAAVVAGGAGAGDLDGWNRIKAFADSLNAALGCTRPAVDEGWAELDTMIGQSGRMVSPDLYIGVGLSGELQHMVGIMDANLMIAINSDAKSPVFEQVDFGIVDDCKAFLPVFMDKINKTC